MTPPQIKPVGASPKICILVHGHPGAGKTRLAGTSPGKVLIIRPPMDHTDSIPPGSAQEWVVRDWTDMNEALEYMRHDGAKEFDWVWFDSISLFQDTGLDDIWLDTITRKPDRAAFGLDKGEYGVNMFRLGSWIRHMVGAPGFNFGITAHPREMIDNDGDPVVMPWIQGRNMADKICGYMTIVGYLTERPVKSGGTARVLYTNVWSRGDQASPIFAKDSYTAFPDGKVLNPTMPTIIEAIEATRSAAPALKRRPRRRSA